MKQLNLQDVTQYVESHIGEFHQKRLDKVCSIQLKGILKAKNPYLLKAKNVTTKTEYKSNGNYYKICGKRFWELISNDANLYIKLIKPLSKEAEEKNKEFKDSYGNLINRLTKEFLEEFCKNDGSIDWEKLLIFNS